MPATELPPLPPGATLDADDDLPAPPSGAVLDGPDVPALPDGAVLDDEQGESAPTKVYSEPVTLAGSIGDAFADMGRGLTRGVGGVMKSIAGASQIPASPMEFVEDIISDTTGKMAPSTMMRRTNAEVMKWIGRKITDAVDPKKSSGFDPKNPTWWAENLPEVAPQLAGQLGLAYATKGRSVPAFMASGGAMMAGGQYEDSLEDSRKKGIPEPEARARALGEAGIVGTIGAALERIPGAEYLTKGPIAGVVRKIIGAPKVVNFVARAGAEGLTEVAQELTSIVTESAVRGEAINAEKAVSRLLAAGILGAAAGGGTSIAIGDSPEAPKPAEPAPETTMAEVAQETPPEITPIAPETPPVVAPPEATVAPPEAETPAPSDPEQQMEAVAVSEPPPVEPINPEPEPIISNPPVVEPGPSGPQPSPEAVQEREPAEAGTAAPTEPQIGVRNAITDQVAKAMGLPDRVTPETYGAQQQIADAQAAVEANPKRGEELVAETNENPRPLNTLETNIVLYELAARKTAFNEAVKRVNEATTAEARTAAEADVRKAREGVQQAIEATRSFGTEQGRALEARKRFIAEQYELPVMQAELQAAKGDELTPQEAEKVTKLNTEIQESDAKVAELEAQEAKAEAQSIFQNLLVEEGKTAEQQAKAGKSLLESLKAGHDEALKNIRRRLGQTNAGADPTVLYDVARIGAYHIANGAKKLADFTKKVVAEVGEWIRPNIEQVFEQSQAIHGANQSAFGTPAKAKKGKKPVDVAALAKADAEKGGLSHRTAYEAVRQKIQQGVEGFDAVMQAAADDLGKLIPGVDRRQVGLAFSEYGKTQFPSKEELKQKLSEYRRIEQLAQAIQDVQEGKAPKKSGPQRNKPTQNVREMMAKLRDEMDKAGIETQTPEQQLSSRNQARATALRNQIADLEKRIQTGEKKVKGPTTPDTDEVKALKQQRDQLKEEADRLYPEDDTGRRIQTALAAVKRSTEEVNRRIREKDFTPKPKRDPVTSKALEDARFRNAQAKREYAEMLFEEKLRREGKVMKGLRVIGNVSNLSRSVITSNDLSGVLRQGGFIATGNPVTAAKAFPDMVKAMMSEKGAQAVADDIAQRGNAKNGLYSRAKLYLADQDSAHPSKIEEAYMSRWLKKNPLQPDQPIRNVGRAVKNVTLAPVRASARAYTAFLNKLRADSFDMLVASLPDGTPTTEEARAIANFVNVATGRGNLGRAEAAGEVLSTAFFSPRYAVSRFQLLTGQPMYGGTNRTRKLIAKEYAKTLAGLGVVYTLLQLWAAGAGEDDDDAPKLETDPRSSDFGKVRIGNTRIDPTFGLAQATTFLSQEFTGEKKSINRPGREGEVTKLREGMRPLSVLRETREDERIKKNRFESDVSGSFLRKKLAPLPASLWNLKTGENVIGEPVTLESEAINSIMPLSVRDILKTMEEQGMSRGAALSLLSIFGMGVNTFLTDEERAKQRER